MESKLTQGLSRLSRCRARKVRCDASIPCGPCRSGGHECIMSGPSAELFRAKPPPTPATGNGYPEELKRRSQSNASQNSPQYDDDQAATDGAMCLASLTNAAFATAATHPPARGPTRVTIDGIQEESPSHTTDASRHVEQTHPRVNDSGLLHFHGNGERPKFLGSSSSQVYIKWFDQEQPGQKLASHFGHAAESVEGMWIPGLSVPHVQLPAAPEMAHYVNTFFAKAYPFFPVVDRSAYRAFADPNISNLEPAGLERVLLYLVVGIGADLAQSKRSLSQIGEQMLQAAWQALPTLLAAVDRRSAQGLILLALACRLRNKDGVSWHLTGYAVRICHGLGMHVHNESSTSNLDARVWFAAATLDRVQSISSGRPSAIKEMDCTVSELALQKNAPPELPDMVVQAHLGMARLCRIISSIQEKLFSAGKSNITTVQALAMIGQSDEALTRWAASLPLDLRPTTENPVRGPLFGWAVHLSVVYNQILILLHRLSLFDDAKLVRPNLEHPQVAPFATRLATSASICANSARVILNCFDDLVRHDRSARIVTTQEPVTLAIFVLSIHTYRNGSSWQARADLSLLDSACQTSMADFQASGFRPDFFKLFAKLYRIVEARVTAGTLATVTRASSPGLSWPAISQNTIQETANEISILANEFDATQYDDDGALQPFVGSNIDVQDLWSSFFGPGVGWSGFVE
ncbi:hypothetical protein OIV83_003559 [Microbotryomycetes sp. JL201]|nr:hypothetical protein OIV83_003559 [Microbotryomycetes sp. JL201]